MKKGQIVEGIIERVDFPNKGILRAEDGTRVIVKNAIMGQKVSAAVNKVRKGKVLKDGQSVNRELILVKVRVEPNQRADVSSIVDIFRANIIDVGKESMIIELTGTKSKLEAFIDLLEGYEILELARTGITGLSRGVDDVFYLEEDGEDY